MAGEWYAGSCADLEVRWCSGSTQEVLSCTQLLLDDAHRLLDCMLRAPDNAFSVSAGYAATMSGRQFAASLPAGNEAAE